MEMHELSVKKNGNVGTFQSQQRKCATNWRDTIVVNTWADAIQT